jgi:hypothetical protein
MQVQIGRLLLCLSILLFRTSQSLACNHTNDDAGSKETERSNHWFDHGQDIYLASLDDRGGTLQNCQKNHRGHIINHGCCCNQLSKRCGQQVKILHQGQGEANTCGSQC